MVFLQKKNFSELLHTLFLMQDVHLNKWFFLKKNLLYHAFLHNNSKVVDIGFMPLKADAALFCLYFAFTLHNPTIIMMLLILTIFIIIAFLYTCL